MAAEMAIPPALVEREHPRAPRAGCARAPRALVQRTARPSPGVRYSKDSSVTTLTWPIGSSRLTEKPCAEAKDRCVRPRVAAPDAKKGPRHLPRALSTS
jgi:hypothetical protein